MFCPRCGMEVPPEGSFCPNCGAPIASSAVERTTGSMGFPSAPSEDSIFREALEKVVTRVYACDYCGAALDVAEGAGKVKCSACGYVNEVDYLRRVSERIRAERVEIIKGAMDSFARVTNLDQLRIPLHERFIAAAYIYESRALRLEDELGDPNPYPDWGESSYQRRKGHRSKIEDEKQFYDASKSWHQVAELYRNASEFAPTPMEGRKDLAASHYYDGLAYFNVTMAPLKMMERISDIRITPGTSSARWSEGPRVCKTVEEIKSAYDLAERDVRYDLAEESLLEKYKNEIRKAEHPILIKPKATDASLRSALNATTCFLRAYEISNEGQHWTCAQVSKLLAYMLYAESIRDQRLVGIQILRKIRSYRSTDINSLKSIVKKFAVFAISHIEDYVSGLQTEWKERGIWTTEWGREAVWRVGKWEGGRGRLSGEGSGFEWRKALAYEGFAHLHVYDYKINIDRIFNQKTASLTLKLRKKGETKGNVGFNFSWVLGRYKTGLFSYSEPSVYLAIESSEGQKGVVSTERFFGSFFEVFTRLASCPSALMNYLGKGYSEETRLRASANVGTLEKDWSLQLTFEQFLELYSSLCSLFTRIRHDSVREVQNQYSDRIQYVELWIERTQELLKAEMPKVLEGANSQILTPEFIGYDMDYLSFLVEILPTLPVSDNKKLKKL